MLKSIQPPRSENYNTKRRRKSKEKHVSANKINLHCLLVALGNRSRVKGFSLRTCSTNSKNKACVCLKHYHTRNGLKNISIQRYGARIQKFFKNDECGYIYKHMYIVVVGRSQGFSFKKSGL